MRDKLKELTINMRIKFCRHSGSAHVMKLSESRQYLIPSCYIDSVKNLDAEFIKIRNGELFYVTNIEVLNKSRRQIKISAIRRQTGQLIYFREDDIGYFVTI